MDPSMTPAQTQAQAEAITTSPALRAESTAQRPTEAELMARPKVVEVDHLDFSFGARQVLFDINLDVRAGEIMVIMGGSGSARPPCCAIWSG